MSKRRRKYAPSEREAEFALGLLGRIFIAAFGAILALFALTNSLSRRRDTDDLLAPRKKQNDLVFAFSRLPKTTKRFLVAFLVLLPFGAGVVYLNPQIPPGILNHVFSVIFLATVFCPIAALVTFWWARVFGLGRDLRADAPHRYESLFHDGRDAFYDRDNLTTYTIRVPRGMEWNAERSTRFIEQLISSFAPLLFRVYADHRSVVWQVVDILGRDTEPIESAIRISYPEADVQIGVSPEFTEPLTAPLYRLTLLYHQTNAFVFPFKYAQEVKEFDPLTAVISAMNGLQTDERVIYSVFVAGESRGAREVGRRLLTKSTITPFDYFSGSGLRYIATVKALDMERVDRYIPEDQKVGEGKLKHPLFQSLFAVQVDSPTRERLLPLATNIDSQLYGFARSPYNGLQWYTGIVQEDGERVAPDPETLIVELDEKWKVFRSSVIGRIIGFTERQNEREARLATRLTLSGQELGLLWHLPDENFVASRIHWLSSRTVPPPPAVIHQDSGYSVQLGHGTQGGRLYPIHLPIKDREKHVRIMGKTGVGKSSLMYDLIMQDIRTGFGVAVIDPHGSLVQSIVETKLTDAQRERVVLIDLADKVTPPPLNPLRGGLGQVRVGQIVQSIERIYPETKRLARTSRLLRAALLTLNADPQATLKDVLRLFTEPAYRERLISTLTDPELHEEWEQFEQMTPSQKRDAIEPLRSRMSPFYSNPDLTDMMCHPDSLDFRSLIQEGKIILISLKMDEERVPETERDLIGSLLLSRLQMSGMYSPDSYPYFVYIDEVQRFVTSSLEHMFSEARKFGLSLTVAHQFLEQLPDTTQSAIIGNAGASIIFGCSPKDAQIFQPFTRPYFEVDDLVNLDQFMAVVKMQCDGVSQPAFTLLTPLPQVEYREDIEQIPMFRRRVELDPALLDGQAFRSHKARARDAEQVRETSRRLYTPKRREEVHAWLRERYGKTIKLDDQTQFFDVEEENTPHADEPPSSVRRIDHFTGGGTIKGD